MKNPIVLRVFVALALACAANAQAPAAPKLEIHDSARVRITQGDLRLEHGAWVVSGQVRGAWPAQAARKKLAIELRGADGQSLWAQTFDVRVQAHTTVRDKHGWRGSFRVVLSLPAGARPTTASLRSGAAPS